MLHLHSCIKSCMYTAKQAVISTECINFTWLSATAQVTEAAFSFIRQPEMIFHVFGYSLILNAQNHLLQFA